MMQSDWLRLSQSIPSSCLKPGQTHATLRCNIFLHCRGQCVAHVFPTCNNTLRDVWWCWIKFKNGQIFVETFLDVVRCSVRLASSLHNMPQHDPTVLQDVALKCWVFLTGLPHSFVNSSLSGHPTFMNSSQFLYCKKWNFKSNSNNLLGSFFTLDVLRPHLHNIN